MPLKIIRNDITKIQCDAIVNAANSSLLGGGGVDGAIHRTAGRELLRECLKLGGCKTGQAKVTGAYKLPCRYVIHTVGPRWRGGRNGEKELLESCYRESLRLALEYKCESVAFPLIASGVYGYPKDQALRVAIDMISGFLLEHDMLVYLVIYDKVAYQISEKLFTDIASYIDDKYVEARFDIRRPQYNYGESAVLPSSGSDWHELPLQPVAAEDRSAKRASAVGEASKKTTEADGTKKAAADKAEKPPQHIFNETVIDRTRVLFAPQAAPRKANSLWEAEDLKLDELMNQIDESFSQMLLRIIDEKGMTDAECYKKANIDRKLFSKIRNDVNYKPSKTTAIAFAIALELSLAETKDMLMKAGYALSHSNKFDIIIEYFISKHNYNVFEINEALFAFDQSLLGV